jgi:hypothetical protein
MSERKINHVSFRGLRMQTAAGALYLDPSEVYFCPSDLDRL